MGMVSRIFPATLNVKERMVNPAVRQRETIAAIGIMDTPFHTTHIFPLSHMEKGYERMQKIILFLVPNWKTNRNQKIHVRLFRAHHTAF